MDSNEYAQPPVDPLFRLGRAILFEMDPEHAHDLALQMLDKASVQRLLRRRYQTVAKPVECLGMTLDNRVGLAAGLDKNGDYVDALGAIGFGHIDIGTVTPRPQVGSIKPRLFRLTQYGALINRLGFNNKGVDHLVERMQSRRYSGMIGINIGKNASTSLDDAEDDYLHCLEKVYPHADYVTVNISSPNTMGLRDLQHGDRLARLLASLKNAQSRLAVLHGKRVPLAVKIAPDMSDSALDAFCTAVLDNEVDAVISGNTTREREPVANHLYARESGGLSGAPAQATG